MTAREISIKNLRGIREGTLKGLGKLTILTGPNGCGKSTVLDALILFCDPDTHGALRTIMQRRPSLTIPARSLVYGSDRGEAEVHVRGVDGRGPTVVQVTEDWMVRLNDAPKEGASPYLVANTHEANNGRYGRFDIGSGSSPRGTPFRFVDPSLQEPLADVYSRAARAGRKGLALSLLRELFGQPDIDLEVLSEENTPSLYIERNSGSTPVGREGEGVQSFLKIALYGADIAGGLMSIEEPETYQHPRAIRLTAKVLAKLVERDVQVVLTTHSMELIRCLCEETNYSDETVVFNLALADGELKSSRNAGEELRTAIETIGVDLR